MSDFLKLYFKGMVIGMGTVIPGISGGTAAIFIGLYEQLLDSVGNFAKNIKTSFFFLIKVAIGAVTGACILIKPIKMLADFNQNIYNFFLCLTSLIGIILYIAFLKRERLIKQFKIYDIFYILIGGFISVLISYLTSTFRLIGTVDNVFVLAFIGIILSLALILPGISFSYMLLFFGIYERALEAIIKFDLLFITVLLIGILLGTAIFSKLILNFIKKYSICTYLFVFGFCISSFLDIILRVTNY